MVGKDVRDFDVEKVQSCKEDIDTLLVFAGLFSAVLSAFLVAAYPNLQPAPSDRMIYVLERIATQTSSYNFTDGRLVAVNTLPSSFPLFEASVEDIKVNVLWFSSLVLSLVTASFGMLVKQWLREFLTAEVPSALVRLRIRHLREPQLKAWKVFEIAALLPVLLHISLGLFFVGLCYFTSSVHSSVGHTTLPLVVGWALCFFGATALPIFLPSCPYKMASLKVLITRLHHTVRRAGTWLESRLSTQTQAEPQAVNVESRLSPWTHPLASLKALIVAFYSAILRVARCLKACLPLRINGVGVVPNARDVESPAPTTPIDSDARGARSVGPESVDPVSHSPPQTDGLASPMSLFAGLFRIGSRIAIALVTQIRSGWFRWAQRREHLKSWCQTAMKKSRSPTWSRFCEHLKIWCRKLAVVAQKIPDEKVIIRESTFDLDILAYADSIQGNDELLGTTITEALHYTHPRPHPCDAVHFIIKLLTHRAPTVEPSERVFEYWPFRDPFPLDVLRPQTRYSVISLLCNYLDSLSKYTQWESSVSCRICRPQGNPDHSSDRGPHYSTVFCAFSLIVSSPAEFLMSNALPVKSLKFLLNGPVYSDMIRILKRNQAESGNLEIRLLGSITKIAGYIGLDMGQGMRILRATLPGLPIFEAGHEESLDLRMWKWPDSTVTGLSILYEEQTLIFLFELASRLEVEYDPYSLEVSPHNPTALRMSHNSVHVNPVLELALHGWIALNPKFESREVVSRSFRKMVGAVLKHGYRSASIIILFIVMLQPQEFTRMLPTLHWRTMNMIASLANSEVGDTTKLKYSHIVEIMTEIRNVSLRLTHVSLVRRRVLLRWCGATAYLFAVVGMESNAHEEFGKIFSDLLPQFRPLVLAGFSKTDSQTWDTDGVYLRQEALSCLHLICVYDYVSRSQDLSPIFPGEFVDILKLLTSDSDLDADYYIRKIRTKDDSNVVDEPASASGSAVILPQVQPGMENKQSIADSDSDWWVG
ncbi:hypothetical protein BDY19DRAFT_144867 [Irpex rosettiformis]|uniref:Uncharacterized protein n=1 Tax=Irpex rosettiformis TaxID=378272 RepID=A0ACB8U3A4_9APHY|nr:hypothetical protein BDY19DRAFT_144867 [Irpex rosettiformis]